VKVLATILAPVGDQIVDHVASIQGLALYRTPTTSARLFQAQAVSSFSVTRGSKFRRHYRSYDAWPFSPDIARTERVAQLRSLASCAPRISAAIIERLNVSLA
jgi:hypothetical protein